MVLVQWALLQEETCRKQERHRKWRHGTTKKNVENKGAATEQVALNKWCHPNDAVLPPPSMSSVPQTCLMLLPCDLEPLVSSHMVLSLGSEAVGPGT